MSYTRTEEDRDFISYWEKEGKKHKNWVFMLKKHLPKGLIFSLPIALFFFVMGPKRRAIVTHADLTIIMICIFLIALFYAVFKGYVDADRLESRYKILKMREDKEGHTTTSY